MLLTPDQQRAVFHRSTRNLLLVACAGSGKTEVVARRVVELLREGNAPSSILAFTFTEKAAGELKDRIHARSQDALGNVLGLAEMYIGTIHGFCLDLLKSEVPAFLKYEVLNQVQQTLFVDRHSQASGLTLSRDLTGKPLRRWIDTPHYVGALSILREATLVPRHLEGCSILAGLDAYRMLCEQKGYLDYSAILDLASRALEQDASLRDRLAARLRHVIVDEYQDLNPVQERIVRSLHELGAGLCVVGDDDQTIYQWRGSDVGNILSFAERYPDVERVDLTANFRSSSGIVELARTFITENTERLSKAMEPAEAQTFEMGDICALALEDPHDEARYIASTIQGLHGVAVQAGEGERGITWSDMAILLRSVKNCGEPITRALRAVGIPFVIVGMNRLFETSEAQAARSLFYLIAAHAGITEREVVEAWERVETGAPPGVVRAAVSKAAEAGRLIRSNDPQRRPFYNIQRLYLTFLEDLQIREETVPGGRGEVLFYNLGKFSQLISDFESIHFHSSPSSKYESFAKFLQYQAEEAYPEGWQDNTFANPDAVRIMTIHQAKGLEWPVVFVPALTRNRFPAKGQGGRSIWHLLPSDGVSGHGRFRGTIEDERRLFYVAVTRSQKFLHLTWAPTPGNKLYQQPSDFWKSMLGSKHVKRFRVDYGKRRRLGPEPRKSVANVVLTFSDLKYFFECPYQFKLRILYGFNAPLDEALGYGKSLHDALAEVHGRAIGGDIATVGEAGRLVQTHLRTPYAYPALREKLAASAERVIRAYLQDNAELLGNIEFSEKAIEISLGDGISVVGRVDLIRRLDTDETTIVDLKSNQRSQAEDVTETQLHVYALGYQELTGRCADYVETYNLDERKKWPRSVDDDFLAEVKERVRSAALALRESSLPARPSPKRCGSCDYQRLCSACSP